MPKISYEAFSWWSNYHLTVLFPEPAGQALGKPGDVPVGILELGRIQIADIADKTPLARLAATGAMLNAHLAHVAARIKKPLPLPGVTPSPGRPYAAGMVGSGWSFTPLIGTAMSQLMCDGLAHVGTIAPEFLHDQWHGEPDKIAIAGAGTRLRELVSWSEPRGWSIKTSGSFLGPTLAGGAATSSHGSRLGFGGAQNLIVGMHIVTGPQSHAWIENPDNPVLSLAGLALLEANASSLKIYRDKEMFEAALVHLGAMGIVNGLAIELIRNDKFHRFKRNKGISRRWLNLVASGEFDAIAQSLGVAGSPVFYEMTIDPHDPFGRQALHTLYLPEQESAALSDPRALQAADAVVAYAGHLSGGHLANLVKGAAAIDAADAPAAALIARLLSGPQSAFAFYRDQGTFTRAGKLGPPQSWGQLHDSDSITGGVPGALYNASFAIERSKVPLAIPAICGAIAELPATFIFTLRFVSHAAGTLAFTRFDDCAVIEIDGLSPFICNKAATSPQPDGSALPQAVSDGFCELAQTLPQGAALVRKALDDAGIAYSLHWAKLGNLDRAKVLADYGDPVQNPDCKLAQWRKSRDILLDEFGRAVFRNPAVEAYGVVG